MKAIEQPGELAINTTAANGNEPLAMVQGEPYVQLPQDLYIPPEALEVFLETFSGPLDLLLYLIKRNNIDILDIPVAEITRQYINYIEIVKDLQLELIGEYLVMSATLVEIKSRMLLPRPNTEEDEDDPRAELVRRLQEYERFKNVAQNLDEIPRVNRDIFVAHSATPDLKIDKPQPDVDLKELLWAFQDVLKRINLQAHHHIRAEPLSIRERMTVILSSIRADAFTPFISFFSDKEGRSGVVVTFIAVLELLKESLIEIVQAEPFAPIHIKAKS
ncbi:MAG: segregation/condensation protein A [Gammaproteobacteria bacterium]|nr:segregation/condensation protein A [Gammaproteobacteria bacterium]